MIFIKGLFVLYKRLDGGLNATNCPRVTGWFLITKKADCGKLEVILMESIRWLAIHWILPKAIPNNPKAIIKYFFCSVASLIIMLSFAVVYLSLRPSHLQRHLPPLRKLK